MYKERDRGRNKRKRQLENIDVKTSEGKKRDRKAK